MSKVDLRLQCGMPCSKLEVSTVQHGTLSGAGYLHQSPICGVTVSGNCKMVACLEPSVIAAIERFVGPELQHCRSPIASTVDVRFGVQLWS